jgi:sec-independent protein translocase protein TatC
MEDAAHQQDESPPDSASRFDAVFTVFADLRRRFFLCAVAVLVTSGIGIYFSGTLIELLKRPFLTVMGPHNKLYFTSPTESIISYMVVGAVAGVIAAAPYVFFHIWWVAAPVLYRRQKVRFLAFSTVSALVFVAGSLFGYFGILPIAIRVLVRAFETDAPFEAYMKISSFLGFSLKLLFAFGLAFELPVVMFLLGRLGVVSARAFWRGARYAVIAIFLAAAVLSPPEIVTQLILAVPLCLLYIAGALSVTLFGKRAEPAAEPPADAPGVAATYAAGGGFDKPAGSG